MTNQLRARNKQTEKTIHKFNSNTIERLGSRFSILSLASPLMGTGSLVKISIEQYLYKLKGHSPSVNKFDYFLNASRKIADKQRTILFVVQERKNSVYAHFAEYFAFRPTRNRFMPTEFNPAVKIITVTGSSKNTVQETLRFFREMREY